LVSASNTRGSDLFSSFSFCVKAYQSMPGCGRSLGLPPRNLGMQGSGI
jgi:hypothetical protein